MNLQQVNQTSFIWSHCYDLLLNIHRVDRVLCVLNQTWRLLAHTFLPYCISKICYGSFKVVCPGITGFRGGETDNTAA